jgi:hypothetical protein
MSTLLCLVRSEQDRHIGLWFLFYATTTSTYADKENLHWAFLNHVALWHYSPPHIQHKCNEGQLRLNLRQLGSHEG